VGEGCGELGGLKKVGVSWGERGVDVVEESIDQLFKERSGLVVGAHEYRPSGDSVREYHIGLMGGAVLQGSFAS